MSSPDKGVEDSPAWKRNNESDEDYRENWECRRCHRVIFGHHCQETGCPWCQTCGERTKNPEHRRNGK